MGRTEKNTTQLLILIIVGIILGLGAIAIGFSAQATRNANEGIFPFTYLLDEDVQTNITYLYSNNTAQLTTLAQLTQQALALTVAGSPPNRTLISSGYARFYPSVGITYTCPNYNDLEGYPNTTWQVYSSELHFGIVIYVLHIDPVVSDTVVYENVLPGLYALHIVLDTNNIFPNSGLGNSPLLVSAYLLPNPFNITGCGVPSECSVPPTILSRFLNPETSSACIEFSPVFEPLISLSEAVNLTFSPNAMTYIKIS